MIGNREVRRLLVRRVQWAIGIGNALGSVESASRIDVFPHDFTFPGHFENPSLVRIQTQRIPIREALYTAGNNAQEFAGLRPRGIFPYDFSTYGIDFYKPRVESINRRIARTASIVVDQDISVVQHFGIVWTYQILILPFALSHSTTWFPSDPNSPTSRRYFQSISR